MKVLVAEDDRTTARRMKAMLDAAQYEVVLAADGQEALALYDEDEFDVVITDWMMPRVDGIELLRSIRDRPGNTPILLMVTSIDSEEGRSHALAAGADAYLPKPCEAEELKACLVASMARRHQKPDRAPIVQTRSLLTLPPFVGVGIAASTGGPDAMEQLFKALPVIPEAAFFVVLHGPSWMFEMCAKRLDEISQMNVRLAESGIAAEPGTAYLAAGDRHMVVDRITRRLDLLDEPPENFVRPAADPLFRSIAEAFGNYSVAVVATGLGCDGSAGAAAISASGGIVLAQDPDSAVAAPMPSHVIDLGIVDFVVPLSSLGERLGIRVTMRCEELAAARG
ncbi:MAG: chemotaxis protein CheB [bacterium]|nr:chemotaxis protein CheB [bacterium]